MPAIRLSPIVPRIAPPRAAVVVFACALLLVAGAAVASLVGLHDAGLAAIVAVAGGTGVCGAALAYAAVGVPEVEEGEPTPRPAARQRPAPATQGAPATQPANAPVRATAAQPLPRTARRIQSLPVAELPPAYLAAVRKGAEVNRAALKARDDRV